MAAFRARLGNPLPSTRATRVGFRWLAGLAVTLLPLAALAQSDSPGPWTTVRAEALRAHVQFLADDLLEGRAAGSRGFDTAAAYVVSQFRQLGLRPAGDDGYLQQVPLVEATAVLPGSSAELRVGGDTLRFEYGSDFLPGADYFSPTTSVTAPLVFAGFGVHAPELDHDDFAGIDVAGRIAVVFDGAPARFRANERAYYSWSMSKHDALVKRGAVGVITIDTRSSAASYPWEQRVAASWMPQMRWLDGDDRPVDAFPELKMRFRFGAEAAARLFAASGHDFDALLDAAEAGATEGFALPGELSVSATTGLRRTQSANVLGLLEGSDPALRRECLVISAHLDHLGRGPAIDGDSIYNGAHDNAAGIGILLEIARALAESDVRPRRCLLFAAVTAEEHGQLGSHYLAHHLPVPGARIIGNLNIDMPLIVGPMLDFIALGAQHSTLGSTALRAVAAEGYALSPDNMPEEANFIRSDQFSFVRLGIPSLYLIGGYKPRFRDTDVDAMQRDFLATHYHRPSDAVGLPMHYPTMAAYARVHVRMALDIAGAQGRPSWHRRDFFGRQFGRTPADGAD